MPSISQSELDALKNTAGLYQTYKRDLEHELAVKDARIASFNGVLNKVLLAIDGLPINYTGPMNGTAYGEALQQAKRTKFSRAERQEQEIRQLHMVVEDLSCRITGARTAIQFAFEHKA